MTSLLHPLACSIVSVHIDHFLLLHRNIGSYSRRTFSAKCGDSRLNVFINLTFHVSWSIQAGGAIFNAKYNRPRINMYNVQRRIYLEQSSFKSIDLRANLKNGLRTYSAQSVTNKNDFANIAKLIVWISEDSWKKCLLREGSEGLRSTVFPENMSIRWKQPFFYTPFFLSNCCSNRLSWFLLKVSGQQ